MRLLITGGAGFVGSRLALFFREGSKNEVVVLDNLRRRGSETNLPFFRKKGIQFIHGDIRQREDLWDLPGNFDLLIDASAEPSVHAGQSGSPFFVIGTNLLGTLNCLDFARHRAGLFLFLSTSRVYSISSLRGIKLHEAEYRFEIAPKQTLPGISVGGIDENFPTQQPRSFYGATKLASELLIQEYAESLGLRALINRCGVITGPGQFGRVDQGIFALWVAHHYFGIPLRFTGFGGTGKQVRDLIHPSDLAELICSQLDHPSYWHAEIFNVGGGREVSASLLEMTALCREVVGRAVPVGATVETNAWDVPLFLNDCRKATQCFGWKPQKNVRTIVVEITQWIRENEEALESVLSSSGNIEAM